MNISVIGVGYVGLSTGIALAYTGNRIKFVDIDTEKINLLGQGKTPFYEPGLDDILGEVYERTLFTCDYQEGLADTDIIIISVGTPPKQDGSPDLGCLWSVVDEIIYYRDIIKPSVLLVNKSTVPVGTVERIKHILNKHGLDIMVASSPEFLRQGSALLDNLCPSRIIAGGDSRACEILRELYEPIINQTFAWPRSLPHFDQAGDQIPVFQMDSKTAELSKYAANAFLAMKISFINEIANIADITGADVKQVAEAIGEDQRIGRMFLNAGIGYGGSCFPKDTRALKHIANTNGYDFKLLTAVIDVNNQQAYRFLNKIKSSLGNLDGKVIALLGLTFKPETDDMREAPSILIINNLLDHGAQLRVHDPVGIDNAMKVLPPEVEFCTGLDQVLTGAEAVGILTEWDLYRSLTPEYLLKHMNGNLIVDGRNCLEPGIFKNTMRYYGMGRG